MARIDYATEIVYESLADYLGSDEVEYFNDTMIKIRTSEGNFIIGVEEE